MPNNDNSNLAGLLFFTGSSSPIVLIGLLLVLEWIHNLSGGGESGLGALFGFIIIPIFMLVIPLIGIAAIIFSLLARSHWLLFLAVQQAGILITYVVYGFGYIDLIASFNIWVMLQLLTMVFSSAYFVFKIQRSF